MSFWSTLPNDWNTERHLEVSKLKLLIVTSHFVSWVFVTQPELILENRGGKTKNGQESPVKWHNYGVFTTSSSNTASI